MKIILLGAPGSGKGTQAALISATFKVPVIATGDLLRAAVRSDSSRGREIKAIMAKGELIADDIILALVIETLTLPEYQAGCLFDGFPRTVNQAQMMHDNGIMLDFIIELQVPDEVVIDRLSGRKIHPGSNRIYHDKTNPPKIPNIDDLTGEPLIIRDDDKPEVIKARLQVYHELTSPVVKFYEDLIVKNITPKPKLIKIDGTKNVNEITRDINIVLQQK